MIIGGSICGEVGSRERGSEIVNEESSVVRLP
jgi:hypothetical protein